MSERPLIWPVRAILWIGGGFVLIAGFQLFGFPHRTDEIFAWTIGSKMTAAFLGAFYLAAAVLALMSAREANWSRARLGVPGVLFFVWLTLIATLIHLDLFHLDSGDGGTRAQMAGWTWLVIYIVEPPLLLTAFVLQLRTPGGNPPRTDPLPGGLRAFLYGLGAASLALGAALFIAPLDVAEHWPWPLTELTGRAVAAWLVALGGLLAAIGWEGDRTRVRLGAYMMATLVVCQALALVRFSEELDFGSGEAIAYLVGLGLVAAATAWLWSASRSWGGPVPRPEQPADEPLVRPG